jgi:hypothetical protein
VFNSLTSVFTVYLSHFLCNCFVLVCFFFYKLLRRLVQKATMHDLRTASRMCIVKSGRSETIDAPPTPPTQPSPLLIPCLLKHACSLLRIRASNCGLLVVVLNARLQNVNITSHVVASWSSNVPLQLHDQKKQILQPPIVTPHLQNIAWRIGWAMGVQIRLTLEPMSVYNLRIASAHNPSTGIVTVAIECRDMLSTFICFLELIHDQFLFYFYFFCSYQMHLFNISYCSQFHRAVQAATIIIQSF